MENRPGSNLEHCPVCKRSFTVTLWRCHEHRHDRAGCFHCRAKADGICIDCHEFLCVSELLGSHRNHLIQIADYRICDWCNGDGELLRRDVHEESFRLRCPHCFRRGYVKKPTTPPKQTLTPRTPASPPSRPPAPRPRVPHQVQGPLQSQMEEILEALTELPSKAPPEPKSDRGSILRGLGALAALILIAGLVGVLMFITTEDGGELMKAWEAYLTGR